MSAESTCQQTSEMDRQVYRKQKNYQKMLQQLEVIRTKSAREKEEVQSLMCVLEKENANKLKLKLKLKEIQKKVADVQAKKKSLSETTKSEVAEAQQELAEAKSRLADILAETAESKKQLQEILSELRLETANKQTLEEKRACVKKQMTKAEFQLSQEKEQLAVDTAEYETTLLRVKELDKDNFELEQRTAEAELARDALDGVILADEEALSCLRTEREELLAFSESVYENEMTAKMRLKCLQKSLKDYQEKLATKRREQKQLKCRVAEREIELQKLQENKHKCFVCEKTTIQCCQ